MKAAWRAAAGFRDTEWPRSKTAGEIQSWWVESSANKDFVRVLNAQQRGQAWLLLLGKELGL